MQTVMSRIRRVHPLAWVGAVVALVLATALPLALRARAQDAHDHAEHAGEEQSAAVEEDAHAGHDHEAGESDEEAVVVELDAEALELAGIKTERVRVREMNEWLEAPGVIHANPDETAVISPSVAGTVESVKASAGDRVRRGQTLVVLRSPELATAQADVSAAEARLEAATDALNRRRSLAEEGEFTSAPYEEARRAYEEASETLHLAEQKLTQARRLRELGAPTQPALEEATRELSEAREAVRAVEADLASAKASLATAERVASRAATSPGESAARAATKAQVANAETALATAQANTQRLASLLPDGLATQQQLDESKAAEAAAKAEVAAAKYDLRTVDDSADEAGLSVATAQQDLARAETAHREAQSRLTVAESRHERERTVADEDIPAKAQLAEAETKTAVARAAFKQAQQAWEREQRLHANGARSHDALAELEAGVAGARARLAATQRYVDALGQGRQGSRGRLSITAPVSGKVSIRNARVGAMVEAGATLLEIVGARSVWVEAGFYEKDVPLLSVGQSMQIGIAAFPGQTFETTIHSIDPALDEHTRKATVRGIIDNEDGRLLPDMFASVRVHVGSVTNALAVPELAVQSDGQCEFVFVEEAPGRYHRIEVQTGQRTGGLVEIRGGVERGQAVVTDGAFFLKSETAEIADSCGGH